MPWKKKSYSLLKSSTKNTGSVGTYKAKPNPNCSNCPHGPPRSLTPSSSSSSSIGLISSLPKQKNTKKFHKIL